jgi:hypothetical protein
MRLFVYIWFIVALAACAHAGVKSDVSRAIGVAEDLVSSYGYTQAPPSVADEDLPLEIWDGLVSVEELKRTRHNYLEPKAIGYVSRPDGWWVVFRVTDEALKSGKDIFPFRPIGRHIFVDRQLNAGVVHSWADLSDPEMEPVH